MGVKGFQKGHIVSEETRAKISKANNGNFFAICDYCGKKYHTKKSAFIKRKRQEQKFLSHYLIYQKK